ncbi:LacI family DNA-binding transcriptional regulator [Sutcliffiella halmapala]|uniref:LacI family DNA-binding transcriptional regulator n=1 Tax=Sutcliffiella halmapala TaxID=79882 RepID=UPI000994ECCE|nr:LacI family DNA-binding transcriptional regulator [Sutcliffiella halmapala]
MKKVTMQDVAKKANVSKSTVSQFINCRYEYMAEDTKKRIEQAIYELGYIPNQIAKSLKQKKTSTIGVIVANILHMFSTEIIRSIEDVCENNDFHLFVCNADDDPKKERSYIEMLMAKQVDGLIIFPTSGNADLYEKIKKSNFPIVFLDRKMDPPIYPILMLDNEKAAQLAVDPIIQSGKTKIGLVSTSVTRGITPRMERIAGFEKVLVNNGLPLNKDWIITADRHEIVDRLEKVWEGEDRPSAFFATNDLSLIELLKFLKAKNLRIPEDVSVTAIDDSPFLDFSTPPITVVKQPTFEMGKDAAIKILELIGNKQLDEEYEIKRYLPSLIKRGSV